MTDAALSLFQLTAWLCSCNSIVATALTKPSIIKILLRQRLISSVARASIFLQATV